jgi:hypothetical protein
MFKVVVNAHNLKEIQTEPVEFSKHKDENYIYLLTQALHDIIIFHDRGGFKNFSLTIHISEVKE